MNGVPGMRVADFDPPGAGSWRPYILRLCSAWNGAKAPNGGWRPFPINLGEALSNQLGSDNMSLRPEDSVTIYSQNELGQVPMVEVLGQVRKPGKYPLDSRHDGAGVGLFRRWLAG